MKSYLSLIPLSAKAHRRQSRMTVLCIVCAVFLVTGVFSMAEAGIRMETARLVGKHGTASILSAMNSASAQNYFLIAGVLFVLILVAGVLMISGSIGSGVAERIKFFGMLRCIGMSRRQIIRFVRLEALNWCKAAIPAGVGLGVVCSWILCAVLRYLVGEEFAGIPLFGVSAIGIGSGILVGVVTVLLAAGAPARRAAAVSPVAAVSGNGERAADKGRAANTNLCKVDIAIGVHHATERKKNLLLVSGSFALSIVLFLAFSACIDLVNCMMPQSSAAADFSVASVDGENALDSGLPGKLAGMSGVLHAYGRRSLLGVEADIRKGNYSADTVDLVSYDEFDLGCLEKDRAVQPGGRLESVYGNSAFALLIADPDTPLTVGDRIGIGRETLTVAGKLKMNPFSADGGSDGTVTLLVSDETFVRLTGIRGYSLIQMQTAKDISPEAVEALRRAGEAAGDFRDLRDGQTGNTYTAFLCCVYGFLTVIALITVLNIVNCIAMSANARVRQYGTMRAVGMEGRQIARMIAAEAGTYGLMGCAVGCGAGLLLHKLLTDLLITSHFPYVKWTFPGVSVTVILLLVLAAVLLATVAPVKRICRMSVTESVGEP